MVSSVRLWPHTGVQTLLMAFKVIALDDVHDGTLLTLKHKNVTKTIYVWEIDIKKFLPRPDRPTKRRSLNLATWFFITAVEFRNSAQ